MVKATEKIKATTTVAGVELVAGTIYSRGDSLTFAYDEAYVAHHKSYDLFPCLQRSSFAPFHFSGLGPFSDSAPDRWGRTLINRNLKRTKVSEIEYLLNVDDFARQGSLRFYINDEPQLSNSNIPLVIDLPNLLTIADDVVLRNNITDDNALKLFYATGSLGGARPKACVMDGNVLYVAKFPKPTGDVWDVIGWEYVTMKLARQFGIRVPGTRLISVSDSQNRNRNVMLSERFDRDDVGNRRHYMSAMTALEMSDGEGADWLDLAELTRELGGDVHELWLRAIFGTAIGNLDNHLRNHAFLMSDCGWELSPAFDMNPEPLGKAPDVFQLSLFGENELNLQAFKTKRALELFGITQNACNDACQLLASVLKNAVKEARKVKLGAKSIEAIASRFEF